MKQTNTAEIDAMRHENKGPLFCRGCPLSPSFVRRVGFRQVWRISINAKKEEKAEREHKNERKKEMPNPNELIVLTTEAEHEQHSFPAFCYLDEPAG